MTETTRALVARLAELLSIERAALADFIAMLADFHRQRRWEEAGYANLYDLLVRELRMSKGTAFYRKVAAELVQEYPEFLDALRDGRLCITAVHALSKAITPESRAEVLPRFFQVIDEGSEGHLGGDRTRHRGASPGGRHRHACTALA